MLGTFAWGSAYLRLYLLRFITHSYTSLLISFQLTLVHSSRCLKPYGFTVHSHKAVYALRLYGTCSSVIAISDLYLVAGARFFFMILYGCKL